MFARDIDIAYATPYRLYLLYDISYFYARAAFFISTVFIIYIISLIFIV